MPGGGRARLVAAAEIRRNHAKDLSCRMFDSAPSPMYLDFIYLTTFIPFPHFSSASSPQAPHAYGHK